MKNRLPSWFKQGLPSREVLEFSGIIKDKFKLNTVCHSAKCPNMPVCFSKRHATFLILGNHCTRNCRFCNIEQYSTDTEFNQEFFVDSQEPYRIAQAVKYLNLDYVVVTSVTRDDLQDGGAQHFVRTIQEVRKFNPDIGIELLIPDFCGSTEALEKVVQEKPVVMSHNLETVKRIYPLIRDKASYDRSLNLLKNIKLINPNQTTKTSIMLGLGEQGGDLEEVLADLRNVNCDMLVLGQYLRPSPQLFPVRKFYSPEEFKYWEKFAYDLGFKNVSAFPLARTSFQVKTRLTEQGERKSLSKFGP
jgi:lipoic acid synthetase